MGVFSCGEKLVNFINASPSPFHAVNECKNKLLAAGFVQLFENQSWSLAAGGKYFFTRNSSTIIGFTVGNAYKCGNGVAILAAHTDSPCLRVKPKCDKIAKGNYVQMGVQTYGGGLWHTWFDRDLSLAGRIITRPIGKVQINSSSLGLKEHLIKINGPVLRIPTLAIHLDRKVDADGFSFNKETHLLPIAGLSPNNSEDVLQAANAQKIPLLNQIVCGFVNEATEELLDAELCLYDTQPACIGGLDGEFVFAARLDNLLMTFCALSAFVEHFSAEEALQNAQISMICCFDHEEVGSNSAEGAGSSALEGTLQRIVESFCSDAEKRSFHNIYGQTISRSFLISADCAHAMHPNYADKHEDSHRPLLNEGVVLKLNANQRYATNAVTGSILKQFAALAGVPIQEFCVRNDMPCGSTIGPILACGNSLRTVDVGNPQLSMHSIRETAGTKDILYAIKLFKEFFTSFKRI